MNTKLNNENEIKVAFSNKFNNEEDSIKHLKQMISYRILGEVERITDEREIIRKDLAKLLDVTPSYITQLYRGTKVVNLDLLAKMEKTLNFRFEVSAVTQDILELNSGSGHSWDDEQIHRIINKLRPPKGCIIYSKYVWSGKDFPKPNTIWKKHSKNNKNSSEEIKISIAL